MTYFLGIDLGTTYTAAAVWRDGRARITYLGARSATIPSVVLLRDDGEVLFGDAAERRAIMEPQRIAREFKRRIGDPTPLIVGGTPYSADALTAKLLRSVVDQVAADEGDPPAGIAVSHPANWGDYKQDLLRQSIRLADLDDVALVTEPEAAAIQYAGQEGVGADSVIAVYDLGGGTFDAAVLRRTGDGWETLGEPEGIERLGGVDFDEAVFQHVARTALPVRDQSLDQLDTDDPPTVTAVARLRRECVAAKEALTADTLASIPVYLPSAQTDVRLTRGEFEEMIRPSLLDTVAALQRALRTAEVAPDEVATVLLAGGSSRIPLVAQMVGEELGRPVALDPHPKHGVALGAATVAADRGPVGSAVPPGPTSTDGDSVESSDGGDDDVFAGPASAAAELAGGALAGLLVSDSAASATAAGDSVGEASLATATGDDVASAPTAATDEADEAAEATAAVEAAPATEAAVAADTTTPPEGAIPTPPQPQPAVAATAPPPAAPTGPPPQAEPREGERERHPVGLLVGAAVAAFLLIVVGVVALRTDGASGNRSDVDAAETPDQPAPGGGASGERSDEDAPDNMADSNSTTIPPGSTASTTRDGAPSTTDRDGRTATTAGATTSTEATTTTTLATTTTTEATTTTTEATTTTTTLP